MDEKLMLQSIGQLLDEKLEPVYNKLGSMEDRLTGVEDRLTGVEDKLTCVEDKLTCVEDKLTCVEDRLTGMEGRMTGVEGRLLKLELDNETIIIPNIQKLAEGYEPLYNKVIKQGLAIDDLCERADVLEISTKRNSQDIANLKTLVNASI